MRMRTCFVLLILVILVAPVGATTVWDVEYFTRGDISQVRNFYDAGAYQFLLTSVPQTSTVYLLELGKIYYADGTSYIGLDWAFIGYYVQGYPGSDYAPGYHGSAGLPEGFPVILFPPGDDQAIAVPILQPDPLPGPSAAVPEPSTLWLMLLALTVYAVLLGTRALVGEPGRGGGTVTT
jgi:PEP-CTERM motif